MLTTINNLLLLHKMHAYSSSDSTTSLNSSISSVGFSLINPVRKCWSCYNPQLLKSNHYAYKNCDWYHFDCNFNNLSTNPNPITNSFYTFSYHGSSTKVASKFSGGVGASKSTSPLFRFSALLTGRRICCHGNQSSRF